MPHISAKYLELGIVRCSGKVVNNFTGSMREETSVIMFKETLRLSHKYLV
jgi:hypothetical protein